MRGHPNEGVVARRLAIEGTNIDVFTATRTRMTLVISDPEMAKALPQGFTHAP